MFDPVPDRFFSLLRDRIFNMARRGENRILVTFGCVDCRQRTYNSNKSRRNDPQRLELKKYCPRCRTHTLHREVR